MDLSSLSLSALFFFVLYVWKLMNILYLEGESGMSGGDGNCLNAMHTEVSQLLTLFPMWLSIICL